MHVQSFHNTMKFINMWSSLTTQTKSVVQLACQHVILSSNFYLILDRSPQVDLQNDKETENAGLSFISPQSNLLKWIDGILHAHAHISIQFLFTFKFQDRKIHQGKILARAFWTTN